MPKACDACQSATAVVFCKADAAYLCVACDSKVHGANKLASRHERVWMCEVCELSPAVVTCKADAAALCMQCDADIHSANPLARRHERVRITPFYECPSMVKVAHIHGSSVVGETGESAEDFKRERHEHILADDDPSAAEAASWLLPRPQRVGVDVVRHENVAVVPGSPYAQSSLEHRPIDLSRLPKAKLEAPTPDLFSDVDPYLDLDYAQAMSQPPHVTDSLVPVCSTDVGSQQSPSSNGSGSFDSQGTPKSFPYGSSALSHSMSSSSMDVGVVPDTSDMSTSYDAHDLQFQFPSRILHVGQMQPMAREARVLRYKEKRKNRKFEKTIRYASRKAYAESRPRIKGRFAKRSDGKDVEETSVDGLFAMVPSQSFGVVPSFEA